MDSDELGKVSSEHQANRLNEYFNMEAKAITLQGAKDPDEYIRKFGIAPLEKILGIKN